MHYVYLLVNSKKEIYIGRTSDLKRRMLEHNSGKSFHTKKTKPWRLIYYEAYASLGDAKDREKKLKRYGQARTHLKNRLKESLNLI